VGDTVALVHGDLSRPAALGELVAEAALAGPGLSNHPDDLRFSCDHSFERGVQGGHLTLAADELGEATRSRHVEPGTHRAEPFERVDPERLPHAFEVEHPERS
jgi:hypothetical protein